VRLALSRTRLYTTPVKNNAVQVIFNGILTVDGGVGGGHAAMENDRTGSV